MYEAYWQLIKKPFENSFDDEFYVPSEAHEGVMLKLRYALETRREAAVLVGSTGLGKTLLVRRLARQFAGKTTPFVQCEFPQMPADQLLAYLAQELTGKAGQPRATIEQSVRRIRGFLEANSKAGQHAVMVLEEAHWFRDLEALKTLRLLLNLGRGDLPAFTLLLVGQPDFLPLLDRVAELNEHLDLRCVLRRFDREETRAYVEHRLKTAGVSRPLFDDQALVEIHRLAEGSPRRINRLGDFALLVGFAEGLTTIGPEQIRAVDEELSGGGAARAA